MCSVSTGDFRDESSDNSAAPSEVYKLIIALSAAPSEVYKMIKVYNMYGHQH